MFVKQYPAAMSNQELRKIQHLNYLIHGPTGHWVPDARLHRWTGLNNTWLPPIPGGRDILLFQGQLPHLVGMECSLAISTKAKMSSVSYKFYLGWQRPFRGTNGLYARMVSTLFQRGDNACSRKCRMSANLPSARTDLCLSQIFSRVSQQ